MTSWFSVEQAVSLCIAGVLCAAVLNTAAGPASAAFEGVQPIEVPKPFGGWVTALPDGRLITWWTEDKEGSKDDTGSVQLAFARYSSDKGEAWTEPQLLFEFPRSEGKCRFTRDAYGITLGDRDGGIHLFVYYFCHWSWEEFKGKCLVFHVMSADNGKTWSEGQFLPSDYQYNGTHTAIQLSTGRILVPCWHAFEDKRDWGVFCVISDDGGETWRKASGEMDPALFRDETTLVELGDGRVWALARDYEGGNLDEGYSGDGGETWYGAQKSRFVAPASPPAVLRLQDGRMIVVWNNSLKPKHVINRLVLAATISANVGKTWYGYREIARTSGVEGHGGLVVYPHITQTSDGTVIVTYQTQGWGVMLIRLDPEWLMETTFREDFSQGLDNWITLRTEGVTLVPHPNWGNRQALSLRKPNPEVAAGASLNFPFGAQGHLTIKLQLQPGFQGARIGLTDHFSWPYYAEDGRFGISLSPGGEVSVGTGEDEFTATGAALAAGKWHKLTWDWDCAAGSCRLSLDGKHVADLTQLSRAAGLCYLRLWSAAETTDEAGLLVDSVTVGVQP